MFIEFHAFSNWDSPALQGLPQVSQGFVYSVRLIASLACSSTPCEIERKIFKTCIRNSLVIREGDAFGVNCCICFLSYTTIYLIIISTFLETANMMLHM